MFRSTPGRDFDRPAGPSRGVPSGRSASLGLAHGVPLGLVWFAFLSLSLALWTTPVCAETIRGITVSTHTDGREYGWDVIGPTMDELIETSSRLEAAPGGSGVVWPRLYLMMPVFWIHGVEPGSNDRWGLDAKGAPAALDAVRQWRRSTLAEQGDHGYRQLARYLVCRSLGGDGVPLRILCRHHRERLRRRWQPGRQRHRPAEFQYGTRR